MSKYRVPFVDFPAQYQQIKPEIDGAIEGCLLRGDLVLRDEVEEFENTLANFTGSKYAVGLNSGTDALILSLMAAGIKPGDEVITTAFTFNATIAAIVHCGAIAAIVDIGPETLLIDPDEIEKKIRPQTRAIIPVHLAGAVCDMDRIMEIAEKHDLIVIEDAAQAFGAKGIGKGLTACWSFYPAKILGAYGDAGAITTNDRKVAEIVRSLRHGGRNEEKEIVRHGFTSRLDEIQAAVLNVKMRKIGFYLRRRKEIGAMYNEWLKDVEALTLPVSEVYQDYTLRVEDKDDLREHLEAEGVETMDGHYSVPFDILSLSNTIKANETALRLPIAPELSDEQIEFVVKKIKEWYEAHRER